MPHSHRSGQLKQKNKEHKTGRHRSKGQLDRDENGVFLHTFDRGKLAIIFFAHFLFR